MNEYRTYHQPGVLRVLQTKEETKAFYNKIAKVYDFLAEHSEEPVRRAGLEMLSAQVGQKVLEIGFGTGHCLIELARSVGPSGRVFGIDLSEKMVEISQKRACEEGLDGRIELSCGDALHLPYASGTMDGIFMSFTLELFDTPEISIVLTECKRILKAGGQLVVVGMSRVRPKGLVMEIFEWTHRHFPNFLDCRPILVRQALEDAGFQAHDSKIMKMWICVEVVCGIKGTDLKFYMEVLDNAKSEDNTVPNRFLKTLSCSLGIRSRLGSAESRYVTLPARCGCAARAAFNK